jgi:hypothetical protein
MTNEARKFVSEVLDMASGRGLNVFVVTDGASGTLNHGSDAVANARTAHREWEAANGYDPDETWRR